jgi:hypothetical protein
MATNDGDDIDGARELLEVTVQEIAAAVAGPLARGWELSPSATLLGTCRALVQLALRHLHAHPGQRAAVLSMLRDVVAAVETETAATTH